MTGSIQQPSRGEEGAEPSFSYPPIVRAEHPAATDGQTFGMVMTAVAEQFSAGLAIDLLDPDETTLNIETTIGFLSDQFGQVARRLGWIPTPARSDS